MLVGLAAIGGGGEEDQPEAGSADILPAVDAESDAASSSGEATSEAPSSTVPSTTSQAPNTSDAAASSGEADEVDDVQSCTWNGDDVIITLVNNSSKTSTYMITTAYLDGAGNRVGDETHFITAVRPNETAIESGLSFEDPTPGCEVIDVERMAADSDPAEMAEAPDCVLGAPNVFDDATATVTATNGSSEISDYSVEVAFVDNGGIRVGSGAAYIESVRPSESAPSDVFTTVDAGQVASCAVVAVDRSASL